MPRRDGNKRFHSTNRKPKGRVSKKQTGRNKPKGRDEK